MRTLKFLFSTVIALFTAFLIGGLMIPDEWTVSRSITIHASTDRIYPFLSNFKEWEKWSPWNASKDATLKYTYEGPATGIGAKQSWTSEKMGKGWMQFTSANPQTGVAYDLYIDMGRSQSTLHGNIDLSADGDSTNVTWTDRGNSEASFIKRWMSLMIKPMLGKDIDKGLAGLKTIAE